jgi:hypothetical protein
MALGLFQDFGAPRNDSTPDADWVEGLAILAAILVVVSIPLIFFARNLTADSALGPCGFFE